MKRKVAMVVALLSLGSPLLAGSVTCSSAPYENTARAWGKVVDPPFSSGGVVVGFYMQTWNPADTTTPTGFWVRFECGSAAKASALGCDQIRQGDSILVSGHMEGYAASCVTGPNDVAVPNLVYRCADHQYGSCVLLTPCS